MAGSGQRRINVRSGTGDQRTRASSRALPDRYELIGLVAHGGMAVVWAARDRKLDREVAVKLLAERFAPDEVAVRRFKREARAAARLSGHPHVVTIYDVGQRAPSDEAPFGRPFIVMDFLAGGTVSDAARLGRVSQAEAVRWLHGAAAALDHAHGRGVIHRDVKLSNFLLDDRRALHVADFGIASLGTEDTLTGAGQLLGTAAYLAPERALGQPATAASDRYSLAVCAFELLVGERPFTGDEATSLALQHVEAPPPAASARNRGLPKALDSVLARGMAKRPEERWPTAADFAAAVEGALAARGPRAPRATPLALRTGGARRVAPVAALAAAALVVGIAAGARTGGSGPSGAPATGRATAHPPPPLTRAAAKPAPHAAPVPPTTSASPSTTASSSPGSADALETRGHGLMAAGDYEAAISVLRHAVAAAPSGSLMYAYALYDLGRSLRLSGDPQAAIPILSRRLAIPNQTGVVRAELRRAMQAAGHGAPTASSGGGAPAPRYRHIRHHDHGPPSGGASLGQGD
jgi:serine/threonine-protein kinase